MEYLNFTQNSRLKNILGHFFPRILFCLRNRMHKKKKEKTITFILGISLYNYTAVGFFCELGKKTW